MKYRLFYTHALRFPKALGISGRIPRGNSATSFVFIYLYVDKCIFRFQIRSLNILQSSYQYQLSKNIKFKNSQVTQIELFLLLYLFK